MYTCRRSYRSIIRSSAAQHAQATRVSRATHHGYCINSYESTATRCPFPTLEVEKKQRMYFKAYEAAHSVQSGPCYRSKSGQFHGCSATYDLWHQRFGHASKQRIKFLYENGMAQGLDVGGEFKHNAKCKYATCLMLNNSKILIGDVRE